MVVQKPKTWNGGEKGTGTCPNKHDVVAIKTVHKKRPQSNGPVNQWRVRPGGWVEWFGIRVHKKVGRVFFMRPLDYRPHPPPVGLLLRWLTHAILLRFHRVYAGVGEDLWARGEISATNIQRQADYLRAILIRFWMEPRLIYGRLFVA